MAAGVKFRNDDPVPMTVDILNSIRFRHSAESSSVKYQVIAIRDFRLIVVTYPHTHSHTHPHMSWQSDRNIGAAVLIRHRRRRRRLQVFRLFELSELSAAPAVQTLMLHWISKMV